MAIGRQRSRLTYFLTVCFPIAKVDFIRYRQGLSAYDGLFFFVTC